MCPDRDEGPSVQEALHLEGCGVRRGGASHTGHRRRHLGGPHPEHATRCASHSSCVRPGIHACRSARGLRLTMANRASGNCPTHVVTALMSATPALQLSPMQATVRPVPGNSPRQVSPVTGPISTPHPLPTLSASAADTGSPLLTINELAFIQVAEGRRFELAVEPEASSGIEGRHRMSITSRAAEIAVITGKPVKKGASDGDRTPCASVATSATLTRNGRRHSKSRSASGQVTADAVSGEAPAITSRRVGGNAFGQLVPSL